MSLSTVSPEAYQIITRKKAQYGRFIDTKQWSLIPSIFVAPHNNGDASSSSSHRTLSFFNPDGTLQTATPGGRGRRFLFSSPEDAAEYWSVMLRKVATSHMFNLAEMEQISADEIRVVWGMEDLLVRDGFFGLARMHGGGFYHEVWKRKGKGDEEDWFVESMRLNRTFQVMTFGWLIFGLLYVLGLPVI